MDYPFISLDGSGYITDPSQKTDAILASYAATQYSQTVLFRNIICSFSKDIQICSQQWEKLPEVMERSLGTLFSAYFSSASIQVTLDETSYNAATSTFQLLISGTVVQAGQPYDLSKMLQVTNGRFSSVTDFGSRNIQNA